MVEETASLAEEHRDERSRARRGGRPRVPTAGLMAGEDEDRHAVVVVAGPAARRLKGPPAGDDSPSGHQLVEDLGVDARQTAGRSLVVAPPPHSCRRCPPSPSPLPGPSFGPATNPSRTRTCRERLPTRGLLSWSVVLAPMSPASTETFIPRPSAQGGRMRSASRLDARRGARRSRIPFGPLSVGGRG